MEYKVSDIGNYWMGDIPKHWDKKSIRYLIKQHISGSWGNDAVESSDNNRICIRIADFDYPKMKIKENIDYTIRNYTQSDIVNKSLSYGDLLIEKSGGGEKTPVGRTVVYRLNEKAMFANFMDCIRLKEELSVEFAKYVFYGLYNRDVTRFYFNQTTGIQNLNMKKYFREVKLPIPPVKEQKNISDYLDKKCFQIDEAIASINEQINVLEKYKHSTITEAVTKGIRSCKEMKESGIEWVGNVPSNWGIMPNKYVMKKIKQICFKHMDEDILSLTMNGVIVRDLDAGGKMPTTFDGYQYLYPGNLLMCLFDYDVTPRCIGLINNYGITSPAYSQFVMKDGNDAKYYYYYYLMIDDTKELLHLAKNLRHSFTEEQLGNIKVPVPSLEEQKEIANYLDDKCKKIDGTIDSKKKEIDVLEQYKKSLIYELVTGKKNLQEV